MLIMIILTDIKNVYVPSVYIKIPFHVDYGKQQCFFHAWLCDYSLAWMEDFVFYARPQAILVLSSS